MSEDPRKELAAIATELGRHLRWAEAKGEMEVPIAEAFAALWDPAAPASTAIRGAGAGATASTDEELQLPSALGAQVGRSAPAAMQAPRAPGEKPGIAGSARSLAAVRADLGACTRCKLCSGRETIVFGDGNPEAELVFVGEAPGMEEDRRGLPFVGAAGQLLDKMIEAMGYRRDQVYICNVVKCHPPGNRNPEPDEVAACEPFLKAQLAAIRPKVIVALGKFAAQTLLQDPAPITRLRGQWRSYEGIRLMPTFHPAYLLRSPGEKGKAWADLQQVMAALGKTR